MLARCRQAEIAQAFYCARCKNQMYWPQTQLVGQRDGFNQPAIEQQQKVVAEHPQHAAAYTCVLTLPWLYGRFGDSEEGQHEAKNGQPEPPMPLCPMRWNGQ